MSKVYTDNVEKRTGGAAIVVPASGQWIDLASAAQGDVQYHNGTSYVRLAPGTAGQVLQTQGAGANPVWAADAGGLFESYSILTDEKTAGTAGGTFTSGAWQTRDLQNEVYDGIGITFSTNEFILPTGNYLIQWSAPAYSVNLHQSRLYDVTGAAIIEYGSTAMATSLLGHYADVGFTRSFGSARVTPSGTNNYKIEHHCEDTYATEGFGHAGGFAVEVYTVVEIFKES